LRNVAVEAAVLPLPKPQPPAAPTFSNNLHVELAITLDPEPLALRSTRIVRGQQCAEAPLDPGGATKQLPARRYLALEGGLTAEPAWAAERRRRRPQEHGWASQRAVAGRGGPGGPDAGRAVVSLSASSASVRRPASGVQCPVSGVRCERHPRLPVHGTVSSVRCGRLSVQVSAVRRPLSGVRCPASGVCALPRPLCPAEVRSWSAGVGRQPYGWDGRGRRGRPLRPCPARRLPESAPGARSWRRRCWASRASVWTWPSSSGGGWAWPARPRGRPGQAGCTPGSFVGGSRCAARLASRGRLIGMRWANRSAGLAG